MNKPQIFNILFVLGLIVFLTSFAKPFEKNGYINITFLNTANGKPIILRDSIYNNSFNENYTISKLKYYISNIILNGDNQFRENESYHLIDASRMNTFSISLPPGKYASINFLAGVDSSRNCSGAQGGALDPLNDMFWTWNTGYVMFKLEGTSPASKGDLNRIEHHIGGYKGPNKTTRNIKLSFAQPLVITNNKPTEIFIETNLDNYWKGINEIRISDIPINTVPGEKAKKAADNFPGMFSLISARL